jgi:hypothetical protein
MAFDLARASCTEYAAAGPAMVLAIEYCECGIALEALLTQTQTNTERARARERERERLNIVKAASHSKHCNQKVYGLRFTV